MRAQSAPPHVITYLPEPMWNRVNRLEIMPCLIGLTLFQAGSGITLSGGGAIMARTDFRLSKMTKRPVSAQNLLSNEYFDL